MSHPNWSPALAASVARIQEQIKDGNPRKRVGWTLCVRGHRATTYAGDPRARGWLRYECKKCGDWGDKMTKEQFTAWKKARRP